MTKTCSLNIRIFMVQMLEEHNTIYFLPCMKTERNTNGGGIMAFVGDDTPSKEIKVNFLPSEVECLFVELNVRKTKWLIVGCCNPPSQNDDYYFCNPRKIIG